MSRPAKTLADYVTIALSPLLIMTLVGSLVFFLIEIFYGQDFNEGGLRYIFFFFVFAIVLIARMSMGEIADRAGIYAVVLGAVVWLALMRFVKYPPESQDLAWLINLFLMGVIWWSAHKLTWDCTLIEDQDPAGAGVLLAAGLENDPRGKGAIVVPAGPDKTKKRESSLVAWWQRYQAYRDERKKKPRSPGVWVIYFSLAALPLYGLGLARIPPEHVTRRTYAFWLMVVYVGSGLGLLLTTSFLDVRRYLRQRKLQMPAVVTSVWLTLGALLIFGMLAVGSQVPRPGDPHPLWDWLGLTSEVQQASSHAQRGEAGGKGKGRNLPKAKGPKDEAGGDREGGDQGEKGDKGKDKKGERKGQGGPGQDKGQKQQGDGQQAQGHDIADASGVLSGLAEALQPLLKIIFTVLIILIIALILLRGFLSFLANFTAWAWRLLAWWESLWKGLRSGRVDEALAEGGPSEVPPPPFSAFHDPFLTGASERMSRAELVRYSFQALEAFARQRRIPRAQEQTPLEFSQRLGEELPALEQAVQHLTRIYVRLAYTDKPMPAECVVVLREFWQSLEEAAGRMVPSGADV